MAVGGDGCDGVAMAHPHLRVWFETLEERVAGIDGGEFCPSIFPGVGLLHPSPIGICNELCSIADAKDWNFSHKKR